MFKEEVRQHFDLIASRYDAYKEKNWYYYSKLKEILHSHIPVGKRVLEIGCGTGELLASVSPGKGIGVEISQGMAEIARGKYPHLTVLVSDAETLELAEKFDYIILSDVVDHLGDIWGVVDGLKKVSTVETKVVITSISPFWGPLIDWAERLGLKMPEGPHNWIPPYMMRSILELNDFEVIHDGRELLIPKKLPFLSEFVNRHFWKVPGLRCLGFVYVLVARPKSLQSYKENREGCSVIVPCYDEEANIAECVRRIEGLGLDMEIIVVDDGSKDKTVEKVRKEMEHNSRIKLISYGENRGKGYAVARGFEVASKDLVAILDADMSVPPEDLPKFLKPLRDGTADFVNGTRMIYAMEEQAMRRFHLVGNWIFGLFFSWLLGHRVTDTLCGTKALKREDLRKMELMEKSWPDFDLLFGAAEAGLRIVEVPARYRRRMGGESKMKTFRHGLLLARMCLSGLLRMKLSLRRS